MKTADNVILTFRQKMPEPRFIRQHKRNATTSYGIVFALQSLWRWHLVNDRIQEGKSNTKTFVLSLVRRAALLVFKPFFNT